MYHSCDDNTTVRCPYNESHIISRSRLQRHIVKCEKNYPEDYKVLCPYDATHRLSKCEIEKHINTCPIKMSIEASLIQQQRAHGMTKAQKEQDSICTIDHEDIQEEEIRLSRK